MAASIALPAHNNNVNNNSGANNREKAAQCTDSELSISLQMEAANNASTTTTDAISESTESSPQPIITISGSFTDSNSVSTSRVYTNQTTNLFLLEFSPLFTTRWSCVGA